MRKTRLADRRSSPTGSTIFAEALEPRRLLSAVTGLVAHPVGTIVPAGASPADIPAGSASPPGYSPTQIKDAYGISGVQFGSVGGTGAGQTIAIVVAYDNPDLVDSTDSGFDNSDLHHFDVALGLPDPPSFKKVDEFGAAVTSSVSSVLGTNPGWANEAALDVEWSHAIAPDANIILVECYSANLSDLVQASMQYITSVSSVSVITMSFAIPEFAGETTTEDSFLSIPSSHQGITILAASGDSGDTPEYPSVSPDVISVGATTLSLSGDSYAGEVGLNTSGGGISQYETKPSFQDGESLSTTHRTTPDVAFDGDKNTGVSVYDSFNGGDSTPWYKVGGTSASTPMWAGMIAIADQGRASVGLGTLNGATQTLPRLYSLNAADFHDITTGNNGDAAGTGYDLVTGLGTPVANLLIRDLAGGNTVSGTVFEDSNGNGTIDTGETGLSGSTVFIDLYGSGVKQGVDPVATSAANGTYSFTDLPGGTFNVTVATPGTGITLTTPLIQTVTLGFDSTVTGKNIGYQFLPEKLAFGQQPSVATQGTAISPAVTVDVEGSNGQIVTTADSAVTLALGGGGTGLSGTLTVNAVNGVATFSDVEVSTTGSQTLVATDGSLTSATSSSFQVAVLIGAAAQLVFESEPSATVAGQVISPAIVVQVEDSKGNVVTTDNSLVTLTGAGGASGAVLDGTLTQQAVNGVATFGDISLTEAGTFSLSASDGSLPAATSEDFAISAASATQLAFDPQPTGATVGQPITPAITVLVEDEFGNTVTSDTSTVTLSFASSPDGANLDGTTTEAVAGGVATFSDITIDTPGSVTLGAVDGGLNAATSNTFTVTPYVAIPTQLAFSQQPLAEPAGTFIRPAIVVDVEDVNGNLDTTDDSAVTLSIATGPAGAALVGATTVDAVDGVATFPGVSLSAAGTYTLAASDGSLTGASSASVVIATAGSITPTVLSSRLPATAIGGTPLNAAVVVKETATASATGNVTTNVYAADDSGLVLLGTVTKKLVAKVGKTYVVSVPVKELPSILTGTYSVVASVVDAAGKTNTGNTGPTTSVSAPVVSLTEKVTKLTLPAGVVAGSKSNAIANVKISNGGNITSTGSTTVAIYLSPDGLQDDATLLSSVTRRLAIGAKKSVAVTVPLRENLSTDGTYQIVAVVTDPGGNATALNTGATVTVAPTTIALNASSVSVTPSTLKPGKSATLTVTLTNTGNTTATGEAVITIGLSSDGVTPTTPITTLEQPEAVRVGHPVVLHLKFKLPDSTVAGNYFPFVTYIQAGASAKIFGATATAVG